MEKNKRYILAVDLGTSGPKVGIFTSFGEVVDYTFEENQVILLPNGGAEQDPDEWWNSIMKAAKRLLAKKRVPRDAIDAICCTTQWSGTVAVDGDGNHLMNAIIWLDSRGRKYLNDITDGLINVQGYGPIRLLRWLRLTGGCPSLSGKDPIAHILFLKNECPEIYRDTYMFLEPKDYINMRFTGKYAASFDSIALHWVTDNRNISKVTYNETLIKKSTVEREKFPRLKQAVDVLGTIKPEVARKLGLRKDVVVVMGTPDVQSAAVGSGAVRDYEGHLYVGTSSWISCHVPFKKTDVLHNIASLPSAIPGRYFVANEQETAGACLNFIRDKLPGMAVALKKGDTVYKAMDRMAASAPPGSGKIIFTPWLYGERTPVEDHTVRAALYNLSLESTPEAIVRAVYEGVAFNSRWLLGYVESFIKRKMETLSIIGGGARSDVWCQIFADILGRDIRQVENPITSNMRGAAFLASVALGHIQFSEIADHIRIKHTFTPNSENRKLYDELFREFREIYKQNQKIYRRLNS